MILTLLQELRECLHRPAGRAWLGGLWAAKSAAGRQAGQPEQAALLSALLAGLLKCLQTQEARLISVTAALTLFSQM